jgi:hypothetical protein
MFGKQQVSSSNLGRLTENVLDVQKVRKQISKTQEQCKLVMVTTPSIEIGNKSECRARKDQ